jgi:CBS domain-containing protein/mannitol/fructose-specific phosphotransferase system IIA component (Ntr-type)
MRLVELLPPAHIRAPLAANAVSGALRELTQALVQAGAVRDVAAVERLLSDPRLRDVVPVGDRVALPHFRTDAVAGVVVALGTAPAPLDPGASGVAISPQVVVLILASPEAAGRYLQTVSSLARLFRAPDFVDRLVACRSPAEVLALPELQEARVQPALTVRDIMNHSVETVAPDRPLREAVDLMVRRGLRALPVVGDKREVLGMLTDREIIRALLPQVPRVGHDAGDAAPAPPAPLTVREVMSRSVLCISEEMSLADVGSTMVNKDVELLPVVSEGKLTGFLTRGDIIRKLFGH